MKNIIKSILFISLMVVYKPVVSQTLVPYLKSNGKYIYVDSATMKPVIEGDFYTADFFIDNFAIVSVYNHQILYNIIDRKGNFLFEFTDSRIENLGGGFITKWNRRKGKTIYNSYEDTISLIQCNLSINPIVYQEGCGYYYSYSNPLPQKKETPVIKYIGAGYVAIESNSINTILYKNGKFQTLNGQISIKFNHNQLNNIFSKNDGKKGIIDTTLKIILQPNYNLIEFGDDGSIMVESNNKYGYFNSKGEKITDIIYDRAEPFSEGLALVAIYEKSSNYYINKSGNVILSDKMKEYAFDGSFHDGLARINKDFLNKIRCFTFHGPDHKDHDEECFYTSYGFIDKVGNVKINPSFDPVKEINKFNYASDFQNGYAVASVGGGHGTISEKGLIDKTGKFIVPNIFNKIDNFKSGFAFCSSGTNYIIFNTKTKKYILKHNPISNNIDSRSDIFSETNYFYQAGDFNNGYSIVREYNRGTGVIDASGKWIIKPIYGWCFKNCNNGFFIENKCHDNFYQSSHDTNCFYIDNTGREYRAFN